MAKYRGRIAGVGLLVAVAAWAMASTGRHAGWGLIAAGTVIVLMAAESVWRGFRGTTGQIRRWNRRTRRTGGVQSLWQHFRTTSSWAMRRQATTIRPSLAELSMWRRYRTPVATYPGRLGRNGRRTLWISAENVVLRVAGARAGKSSAMADRIVDAPGAVVVTSTRVDLLLATAPVRAKWCHPEECRAGAWSSEHRSLSIRLDVDAIVWPPKRRPVTARLVQSPSSSQVSLAIRAGETQVLSPVATAREVMRQLNALLDQANH